MENIGPRKNGASIGSLDRGVDEDRGEEHSKMEGWTIVPLTTVERTAAK